MTKDRSPESLQLALWREAGKHADAIESLPAIAELLAGHLQIRELRLDELNRDTPELVPLARWSAVDGLAAPLDPHACTPRQIAAMEEWALSGNIVERTPQQTWPSALRHLNSISSEHPALAAGLVDERGLAGIAVVVTERLLSAAEKEQFRMATEPLAMIVANDFRLRELRQLQRRIEAERDALKARLERADFSPPLVGAEAGLRQVMVRVRQVAPTDASVLILGETGSGKEVIARTIHEGSPRAAASFVRVNCGAVSADLIDSELFGHERGSFTGAMATRRGWFERANGGTLFLDEIGELAPAVQVRLLRVLQDGIVQRVGGEAEIAVNVRVIAATHRDLPQMVQEGRFREDLWYRIAVFPIILPPLRERTVDIPVLANYFIERAADRAGLPAPLLTPEAIRQLCAYNWPGNVRELGAVLERAVILGQGRRLELEKTFGFAGPGVVSPPATEASAPRNAVRNSEGPSFDAAVKKIIEQAIAASDGRISGPHGAAARLGLNANTLRSKMRKLGLTGRR